MSEGKTAIYLLRHGETEWSLSGQHTGRTDIPLTARGEQQAQEAGATLARLRGMAAPPALVLSSPRQRATRTAELAGLAVDEVTENLAEWNYGDYEGLTSQQIRERVPNWTVWTHPCPNGETIDRIAARADSLLDRARSALPNGDVVLVGHGHFGRVLVLCWLGLSARHGAHIGMDPASISALNEENRQPQLLMLNVH